MGLDIITTKKAMKELGIGRSEMNEIKNEMLKAGYTVHKDGRLTWVRISELEQYLLYERNA